MSTLTDLATHTLLAPGPDELEQHELDRVLARLTAEFPDVRPEVVAELVLRAHRRFDGCRLRTYVPLFVERSVRSTLRLPPAP
ncbi:hypothetical protein RHODO2019_08485 [Rhodococcus antarcticus]|jgi:hypothetical protein|uniref:Uncharacterized protein n=1 Tax=Rhodococcus antarcticus TaxID=2987751 RepID=A0ABY6P432_9NOCA|nr:hypothetical protein [Rhodococcus antarcticus]UZJ26416.1 hypothetical protein RHODO2019_08485 [Rhodococcus antarcticus]